MLKKLADIEKKLGQLCRKYVRATFIGGEGTALRIGTLVFEPLENEKEHGYFFQNEMGKVRVPINSLEGVSSYGDFGGGILVNETSRRRILGE